MYLNSKSFFAQFVYPFYGAPTHTNLCRLIWHLLLSPIKNVLGLAMLFAWSLVQVVAMICAVLFFGEVRTLVKDSPELGKKGWIYHTSNFVVSRPHRMAAFEKVGPPWWYILAAIIIWIIIVKWNTLGDRAHYILQYGVIGWFTVGMSAAVFVWWLMMSDASLPTVVRGRIADFRRRTCTIVIFD